MNAAILQPVAVLLGWTAIMWVWMYATRIPAMGRAKVDAQRLVGSSGTSLRDQLIAAGEVRASWVADNYNHLHEQPTLFYAVCIAIATAGHGDGMSVEFAWAYVILRIIHSLVQVLSNRVLVRFAVFALASVPLFGLIIHLLRVVF